MKCLRTNKKKTIRHSHNGNQNPVPEGILRIPHTEWNSATNSIPIHLPVQMVLNFIARRHGILKDEKHYPKFEKTITLDNITLIFMYII